MRIIVTGATGNVGTHVLDALSTEPKVDSIVGIARRQPEASWPKTSFVAADVSTTELRPLFEGADAVIHLAWLIQPGRDQKLVRRVNVEGSRRVFEAARDANVAIAVHASSVGAYSAASNKDPVDEGWPTGGIPSSFYSAHKAEVEQWLDAFVADTPSMRIVRLRPGLIFSRAAASGIRRLFAGPLLPSPLVRSTLIPVLPIPRDLTIQAVHSRDVGDAYRRAVIQDVRGAFNLAAEPLLDAAELGDMLGARVVPTSPRLLRALASATWRLHLQPTSPGWLDMGLGVPVMDTSRARTELGWHPERNARDAMLELLEGMRQRAGRPTGPLDPSTGGPLRVSEFLTGIGSR